MEKPGKMSKQRKALVASLCDRTSEERRSIGRSVRDGKRSDRKAKYHTYTVIFADGEIRSAFTRSTREAEILTQAERITGEVDRRANSLDVLQSFMSNWY